MFIIERKKKESAKLQKDSVKLPPWMKNSNSIKPKEPKHVSFAEKLITNEESLDKSMLERIKHNLEYNDDL